LELGQANGDSVVFICNNNALMVQKYNGISAKRSQRFATRVPLVLKRVLTKIFNQILLPL
jgi:hypothetical protein